LNTVAIDKIVYVRRTETGLQSGVDISGRNTERIGLFFIQIDFQLGGVFQTLHANAADGGFLLPISKS